MNTPRPWNKIISKQQECRNMKNEKLSSTVLSETEVPQSRREDVNSDWQRVVRRRSFLTAAELIESDLWQQYYELRGVNGGDPAYMLALENLAGDMPQDLADNTDA